MKVGVALTVNREASAGSASTSTLTTFICPAHHFAKNSTRTRPGQSLISLSNVAAVALTGARGNSSGVLQLPQMGRCSSFSTGTLLSVLQDLQRMRTASLDMEFLLL